MYIDIFTYTHLHRRYTSIYRLFFFASVFFCSLLIFFLQACFFAQHDLIDVTFHIYSPEQMGFSHEQHSSKDERLCRPVQWLIVFNCCIHLLEIHMSCINFGFRMSIDQCSRSVLIDFLLTGTCWVESPWLYLPWQPSRQRWPPYLKNLAMWLAMSAFVVTCVSSVVMLPRFQRGHFLGIFCVEKIWKNWGMESPGKMKIHFFHKHILKEEDLSIWITWASEII